MLRKDKLLGGVLGLAIGDALGVPVEFVQREVLKSSPVESMEGYGSHNQPVGTWSDDTSMVLATLDSMCRGFSTDGMMEAFSRWYNMAEYTPFGEVFDIGGTTRLAIQRYLMGESVNDCGSSDVYSNGNGSLMRMLPMILYLDVTPINSNAVDLIYKVSGLTHAHLISKIACVYYVYIGMYLTVYSDKNEATSMSELNYLVNAPLESINRELREELGIELYVNTLPQIEDHSVSGILRVKRVGEPVRFI